MCSEGGVRSSVVAALVLPDLRFDFAGVRVRGLVRRGVPNHFCSPSSLDGQLFHVRTLLTVFVGQSASLSVLLHVHLSVTLTHVIGDAARLLTSLTHGGRDVRRVVGLEGGVRI